MDSHNFFTLLWVWTLLGLATFILLLFVLSFLLGPNGIQPVTWIFFAIYVGHYTNRSIVWPWRTRTAGKQMPLVVALMALCFNLVNGFINWRSDQVLLDLRKGGKKGYFDEVSIHLREFTNASSQGVASSCFRSFG